jgi:Icc-related predicted phosphoesterase
MRLHVLSDLHLEFAPFVPPDVGADVVVLAGDIHLGVGAIPWALTHLPAAPVVYVLGNHEFYGHALPKHIGTVKQRAEGSGVHVLENEVLTIGDAVILGCTLWTDFNLFGIPRVAGSHATQRMTDYRKIRVNPEYRRLRSIDTALLHRRSRSWLEGQLDQHRGKKLVVVTHHVPSPRSLAPSTVQDLTSAAYASELSEVVERSEARVWVHGHVHTSSDYVIGRTRVICNPRGYPDEPNPHFAPDLIINV